MHSDQVKHLISDDKAQRQAARLFFMQMDEDAVSLLTNEFYAGVSIPLGIALIDLVGEIGGYEAFLFLEDVYKTEREAWGQVAEKWLKHDGLFNW